MIKKSISQKFHSTLYVITLMSSGLSHGGDLSKAVEGQDRHITITWSERFVPGHHFLNVNTAKSEQPDQPILSTSYEFLGITGGAAKVKVTSTATATSMVIDEEYYYYEKGEDKSIIIAIPSLKEEYFFKISKSKKSPGIYTSKIQPFPRK